MIEGTAPEAERERILQGFIEVVGEVGYGAAGLDLVLSRAGVGEATFHRHFGDREDCFVAAWDAITARCRPPALAAFASEDVWLEQMRAVGEQIYRYAVENPAHARIIYVDGSVVGERGRAKLDDTVEVFTELIDLGRNELGDPDSLTRATAEGLAGAIYEQIARHLLRGAVEDLVDLVPQVMFTVARPYLGVEVATQELYRPPFQKPSLHKP